MGRTRTQKAMEPECIIFGNNMARCRLALNKSQADVALELGVPQSTYAGWETGTAKIQLPAMIAVAKYYNVSVDALMSDAPIAPAAASNMELSTIEMEMVRRFRMLGPGERGMLLRSLGIDETSEKRDATTA